MEGSFVLESHTWMQQNNFPYFVRKLVLLACFPYWSRDSSVSIATRLWAGRSEFDSVPELGIFSSPPPYPDRSWGPSSFLSNGYRGFFTPRVKRPRHEADHSPPSSSEVKNASSYTSIPRYVFMAWCLVKYRKKLMDSYKFLYVCQVSRYHPTFITHNFLWITLIWRLWKTSEAGASISSLIYVPEIVCDNRTLKNMHILSRCIL
jgi:hypothetical protein